MEEDQSAVLKGFVSQHFYLWLQDLVLEVRTTESVVQVFATYLVETLEDSVAVAIPLQLRLSLIPRSLGIRRFTMCAHLLDQSWIYAAQHKNARIIEGIRVVHMFAEALFDRHLGGHLGREPCLGLCATVVGHSLACQDWHTDSKASIPLPIPCLLKLRN